MHQTIYWHYVEVGENSSLTIFVNDCRSDLLKSVTAILQLRGLSSPSNQDLMQVILYGDERLPIELNKRLLEATLKCVHATRDVEPGGQRGHGPPTFWQTMQKCPFRIQKCPFQIHNIITFTLILTTLLWMEILAFYSSFLPLKFSI